MQFELRTDWTFEQPIERVWAALHDVAAWPRWWPSVERVELLNDGDRQGVGATHRLTWSTALPYSLRFDTTALRVEAPHLLEATADGDLRGRGLWTLAATTRGTTVRYDWCVDVTQSWMRVLAPLLRPVFAWNHRVVMERGRRGLLQELARAHPP